MNEDPFKTIYFINMYMNRINLCKSGLYPIVRIVLVPDLLTWTDDLGDGDVPLPQGGDTDLDLIAVSPVTSLSRFMIVEN